MSEPRRSDDDRRIVAGAGVLALLALASVVVSAIVCVALLRGSNSRYADVGARTRTISQDVREVLMAGTAMHMRFESLLDPDGEPCLGGADGAEIETFVRHGEELARSLSAYVPGGALSAFTGALADSAQSVRDAQRWRDRHDAFGGVAVADDALKAARTAVDAIRAAIVAVEGRRRLARVLSVRGAHLGDERFIESSDSLRRAIIAAF
ncbi:MAG: hypothetical protein JNL94_09355, partial [Planctomycetes bacterium]|nr:hypothetical protein [Planctomycetota bacterium]